MNKERRKRIAKVIGDINTVRSMLEDIKNEEEFSFDNMPENLQGSMRGEESQEAIDYMDEALEALEEVVSQLEII